MNRTWSAQFVGVAALISQMSCQTGEAIAPRALEPVPVIVTSRPSVPGEQLPDADVIGGALTLSFKVARLATCGLTVDARLNRMPHDLAVVARVYADPLADCVATPRPQVMEYAGSIRVLEPGNYHVRIFDAEGNDTPHLIEVTTVTVSERL